MSSSMVASGLYWPSSHVNYLKSVYSSPVPGCDSAWQLLLNSNGVKKNALVVTKTNTVASSTLSHFFLRYVFLKSLQIWLTKIKPAPSNPPIIPRIKEAGRSASVDGESIVASLTAPEF